MGFVGVVCVCVSLGLKTSGQLLVNLRRCRPILATDNEVFQFAKNVAFLQGEFYLHAAIGKGIDAIDSTLAQGGPPPVGARLANLDSVTRGIFEEFGYQEVGQLREATRATSGRFERPLLNLSREVFAELFDQAVGFQLAPPFDPYANTINFLLAANLLPYVGLVALVGATPQLLLLRSRMTAAGLLGVEAGQDAVIRTLLYESANQTVAPYNITVAHFTNLTASLYTRLGNCGRKYEGLIVPRSHGAENRTESNILAADSRSLSYSISPKELLGLYYRTGDESKPGGFYPKGANGRIARSFIRGG